MDRNNEDRLNITVHTHARFHSIVARELHPGDTLLNYDWLFAVSR